MTQCRFRYYISSCYTCFLMAAWYPSLWSSPPTRATACLRDPLSPQYCSNYISDIPQTTSRQHGYANNLSLFTADKSWENVETVLHQDMQALHDYLVRWRLKFNTEKITITAFHLNNCDSQYKLNVFMNGTALPNDNHSVYIGSHA